MKNTYMSKPCKAGVMYSNSHDSSRFLVIYNLELIAENMGKISLEIMQLYEIEIPEVIPCFSQLLTSALKAHNSLVDQADKVQKMNPYDHLHKPIFWCFLHVVQLLQLEMT